MHIIHILTFFLAELLSAGALEKPGKISEYVFGKQIGDGTFANILLVTKIGTNQEFVAKVPKSNSDAKDLQLFSQEISLLKEISESEAPNVIKYIDSFTDPETGTPVLVLEKVNGVEFYDWIDSNAERIENGQLDRSLIIRLMQEAAKSVKQVHDLGICHRDIKPENFMLTTTNPTIETEGTLLKLVDFGLASKVNEAKGFAGTPDFLSPEFAKAAIRVYKGEINEESYIDRNSKSTDVYSLGVLFYYLLSASLPYASGDNLGALIQIIATHSYEIPQSIQTHYPQMIPLLKSMLDVQERRCTLEEVLKFVMNEGESKQNA